MLKHVSREHLMPSPSRIRSPSSTRITYAGSPGGIPKSARASFAAGRSVRKPSSNYQRVPISETGVCVGDCRDFD